MHFKFDEYKVVVFRLKLGVNRLRLILFIKYGLTSTIVCIACNKTDYKQMNLQIAWLITKDL